MRHEPNVKKNLLAEIVAVVEKTGTPLDISHIATELGVHWWTIYKAIADYVIIELQANHMEILRSMPFVPLKTSKSWVLVPRVLIDDQQDMRKPEVTK